MYNKEKWESKLLSSLEKVFFQMPQGPEYGHGSMLKNEIFSFQLAMYIERPRQQRIVCRLEVESELAPWIQVRQVDYVPSMLPAIEMLCDDDYITRTPGMFPDPLRRLASGNRFDLANHQARALWVTVEPKGAVSGTYPIKLRIFDEEDLLLEEKCFILEIIDAVLPALDIRNTGWFHGDCIAVLHNVPVGSLTYWELFQKYLAEYVRFGHNMILTPVFTPPLDTAVGGERPTNQLVEVTVTAGRYSFDFTALREWFVLCRRFGIRYFEICHLFTQWGAKHAPKIMATVNGGYKRLFGWETDALSVEYRTFLDAFLPKLVTFLKQEGVWEDCFFHVSDEPKEADAEQYRQARALLLPYIPEERLIDALSSYEFYEKGIVKTPIVSTDHIHTFLEHDVENLWAYYCVSQRMKVGNRFMAQPAYRNRILGCQLYQNRIKGFLHWGYNFWFTKHAMAAVDPYRDTCAGGNYPSGDPFVVYPVDEDGNVVVSTRLHVFCEAMQDLRALKLLESLTDRATTAALLEEVSDFTVYPRNNEWLLTMRQKVNERIKQQITGK